MALKDEPIDKQYDVKEKAVLGWMIIDNDAIPVVLAWAEENKYTFSNPTNAEIFDAIKYLHKASGPPIDIVMVRDILKQWGMYDCAVTALDLAFMLDVCPNGGAEHLLEELVNTDI
jgi:replicative DNA helicase